MSDDTTPPKVALYRAARVLGGQAGVAKVLGYKDRRNVSPWFSTDRKFPAEFCPLIEAATRELGDPVTCEELRPDVQWAVLREQGASTDQQAA